MYYKCTNMDKQWVYNTCQREEKIKQNLIEQNNQLQQNRLYTPLINNLMGNIFLNCLPIPLIEKWTIQIYSIWHRCTVYLLFFVVLNFNFKNKINNVILLCMQLPRKVIWSYRRRFWIQVWHLVIWFCFYVFFSFISQMSISLKIKYCWLIWLKYI